MLPVRDPARWRLFVEFAREAVRAGCPDPFLTVTVSLGQRMSPRDRQLLYGCFGVTYCEPSALAIYETLTDWSDDGVRAWAEKHYAHLPLRRERKRPLPSHGKMADCLISWRNWVDSGGEDRLLAMGNLTHEHAYERGWGDLSSVHLFGRYITIRMVQLFQRGTPWHGLAHGIHADGGGYVRRALMLLYPAVDLRSNKRAPIAEQLGRQVWNDLRAEGIFLGFSPVQSLLCEYRQGLERRGYYAAKSHDETLDFIAEMAPYWGESLFDPIMDVRQRLFHTEVLGEDQGWTGLRANVMHTMRDHDYVFSDFAFDWNATTDVAEPIPRVARR